MRKVIVETIVLTLVMLMFFPMQVYGEVKPQIVHIHAGNQSSVMLRNDGTVWRFGESNAVPTRIPDIMNARSVITETLSAYALELRTNGTVWRQYDNPEQRASQIEELDEIVSVDASETHFLALKGDGTVWTWGSNRLAQLGNGEASNTASETPVPIAGLPEIRAVAAGDINLALTRQGTVYAWGWWGREGQGLQDHAADYRTRPVKISGLPKIAAISASGKLALAADIHGNVYAWGDNRLGLTVAGGSAPPDLLEAPQQVAGLQDVQALAAGGVSLFLTGNGEVWSAGDAGTCRRAGSKHRTAARGKLPVKEALSGIVQIAAGPNHQMALNASGTVYAWGNNDAGQLGTGRLGAGRWQCEPLPILDSERVIIDGAEQPYAGIMLQGKAYVPLRELAGTLGAHLAYDKHSKLVQLTFGEQTLIVRPGDREASVNDQRVDMGSQVEIFNNATYVPLRFIAEWAGAKVSWDADRRVISVERAYST
ncbi:hypothetical protein EBB07_18510 [Paenibacillaceae bacterium]|nr:hypothetical protein EBB07_18510 [Paenibacillaceae bacterium]